MIASEIGYQGAIKWDTNKPDGTPRKLLDIERIKKLGWSPKILLKEVLKNTINDFITNYEKNNLKL